MIRKKIFHICKNFFLFVSHYPIYIGACPKEINAPAIILFPIFHIGRRSIIYVEKIREMERVISGKQPLNA